MLNNRGHLWPILRKISAENKPRGSPGLKEKPRRKRRSSKCKPRGFECRNQPGNPGVRGLRRTPWHPYYTFKEGSKDFKSAYSHESPNL